MGTQPYLASTAKPCKGDCHPVIFSTPNSLLLYKVPLLLPLFFSPTSTTSWRWVNEDRWVLPLDKKNPIIALEEVGERVQT